MMNATVITHKLVAIATIILFLFQTAMLRAPFENLAWERRLEETYTRRTIKKEAAERPRLPKNLKVFRALSSNPGRYYHTRGHSRIQM